MIPFILSRNMMRLLAALILFCGAGCDQVYRLLQKEGAEERELLGEVSILESNANVIIVQKLLKLYGYRVGKADGVLGANTRTAIETFQRDNGLPVTRFVDQATWDRLNVFARYGLIVNGEINPKAVQVALKAAGFNPGKPDGKIGQRTQKALRDFQKANRLKADGKIGLKTLNRLAKYLQAVN